MSGKHTRFLGHRLDTDTWQRLTTQARKSAPGGWDESQSRAFSQDSCWVITLSPIEIVSGGEDTLTFRLDVDMVLGLNYDSGIPDIDLIRWQGIERGVSRAHVKLRPGLSHPYAIDLTSTNGTHINGLPIPPGWAYPLRDGDLLSLSRLHLRVNLRAT